MKRFLLIGLLFISFVLGKFDGFAQDLEKNTYYNFGGHVFTDDFPIVKGYAYLYSYENLLETIDTAKIDTLGYYYFYQVPAGEYQVMAGLHPDDPNYQQFSFTFYPNTAYWGDAEPIELNATGWEYDIFLVNQDPELQVSGSGRIAGIISEVSDKPYAQDIDVMLCDEEMKPLCHMATDVNGTFSFDRLATGHYILYPQIIGMTTLPISVHITDSQPEVTDIDITIKDGQIASYINEDLINKQSFSLYPNPSSALLTIEFQTQKLSDYQVRIFNLNGSLVYEKSSRSFLGINYTDVNTQDWQNGYYFIDIVVNEKSAAHQKFAVIH